MRIYMQAFIDVKGRSFYLYVPFEIYPKTARKLFPWRIQAFLSLLFAKGSRTPTIF